MLSYQHAYHAGNHADILKHYVLSCVIEQLNKKEKPYALYDTHAGSGLYDLFDNRSLKTNEAERGILRLKKLLEQKPELKETLAPGLKNYLELTDSFLAQNLYPGSPLIEKSLMRPSDVLILSELHPTEFENLKSNLKGRGQKSSEPQKNIQFHNRSGWEMIKALTPPAQKRGAALIDPSYEETEDYENAAAVICAVHKKWTNGIIMLWYPLVAHRQKEIEHMKQTIKDYVLSVNVNTQIDAFEFCVNTPDAHKEVSLQEVLEDTDKKNPPRLYGSGMLVINTPWNLVQEAQGVVDFLSSIFYS